MIIALCFWALALYGALCIVWQSVRSIQKRMSRGHTHRVNVILVVQNAESTIEGVARTLLATTAFSTRERQLLIVDVHSTDGTGDIVERLAKSYDGLKYIPVTTEAELLGKLKELCSHSHAVACVYDLRDYEMLRDVTYDVTTLLP